MAKLTVSDTKPTPPDADFAITIDFRKGEESPTRVFTAATDFINAFEKIDKVLAGSVDSSIEPLLVLEDVEVGSLKIWLKNALRATDDQAIKDLDWKPALGKYFLRGKYMILQWLEDNSAPRSLPDLRRELQQLASETDIKHLPDYAPPNPNGLIEAVQKIQAAKERLGDGDKVYFEESGGQKMEINLSVSISPDELSEFAIKETISMPPAEMILAVKKPDYLGASKWELRHGRRAIMARIEDLTFLSEFQRRKKDVRPGDALRCMVSIDMKYGFDNELIGESYIIHEVKAILEDDYQQSEMFDEKSD